MSSAIEPSAYPLCAHIKTNGRACQSPAVRGHPLCYFHRKLRHIHRPAVTAEAELATWSPQRIQHYKDHGLDPLEVAAAQPRPGFLKVLPLEDAESIQLAISALFAALANREVEPSHARNLLYALQLASYNARSISRDSGNSRTATPAAIASATAIATASDGSSAVATAHAATSKLASNDDFADNPNAQTILSTSMPANSSGDTNF